MDNKLFQYVKNNFEIFSVLYSWLPDLLDKFAADGEERRLGPLTGTVRQGSQLEYI